MRKRQKIERDTQKHTEEEIGKGKERNRERKRKTK